MVVVGARRECLEDKTLTQYIGIFYEKVDSKIKTCHYGMQVWSKKLQKNLQSGNGNISNGRFLHFSHNQKVETYRFLVGGTGDLI